MQVVALGLPFMFGFFVFISLMRGAGDTITPMLVMFGTVVINVILDPFLINGWSVGPLAFPELGIQGRLSPLSSPGGWRCSSASTSCCRERAGSRSISPI